MTPAETLKAFRAKHGLSKLKAAQKLGTNHVTWASWEAGETVPAPYILLALVEVDRRLTKSDEKLWF